jgi:hypothetical protein
MNQTKIKLHIQAPGKNFQVPCICLPLPLSILKKPKVSAQLFSTDHLSISQLMVHGPVLDCGLICARLSTTFWDVKPCSLVEVY